MPRIARTIVPRIRKSLREHGVLKSLCRSFLLPIHLVREYRAARSLPADEPLSEFDDAHGVHTDGERGGWTYLSDLEIASPNWIQGRDYTPIEPERFNKVLASMPIPFGEYTFVDFGSGKGRALLLASEYAFRRIVGVEFSPELHRIAVENIQRYRSPSQKCANLESLNLDFADFAIPSGPLVLFFFDPCQPPVFEKVLQRIGQSFAAERRSVYLAYVAPGNDVERLFTRTGFLKEIYRSVDLNFLVYST